MKKNKWETRSTWSTSTSMRSRHWSTTRPTTTICRRMKLLASGRGQALRSRSLSLRPRRLRPRQAHGRP
eukprot:3668233-Pyramimonas_sp.AAC.1